MGLARSLRARKEDVRAMSMVLADCKFCDGSGRVHQTTNAPGGDYPCYACAGAGSVMVQMDREGAPTPCSFCDGTGRIDPDVPKPKGNYPCPGCDGCGYAGRPDLGVTESS